MTPHGVISIAFHVNGMPWSCAKLWRWTQAPYSMVSGSALIEQICIQCLLGDWNCARWQENKDRTHAFSNGAYNLIKISRRELC